LLAPGEPWQNLVRYYRGLRLCLLRFVNDGFVFGLPLQRIVATSGVLVIVLGLALQNTLGDVFSGLSLSVETPYDVKWIWD
jgi:small-conductance mechanosensitive channel